MFFGEPFLVLLNRHTILWFYTITNFAAWNSTSELFAKANIGGRPRQAGRICIMLPSCCYCCQRNIMTLKNWPWALLLATKSIFLCQRLNLKTLNTATNDWATLEFWTDWTTVYRLDSKTLAVQDFLIKLDIKPRLINWK